MNRAKIIAAITAFLALPVVALLIHAMLPQPASQLQRAKYEEGVRQQCTMVLVYRHPEPCDAVWGRPRLVLLTRDERQP
jgi:hypothetical protein